jgi:hypothetical protein
MYQPTRYLASRHLIGELHAFPGVRSLATALPRHARWLRVASTAAKHRYDLASALWPTVFETTRCACSRTGGRWQATALREKRVKRLLDWRHFEFVLYSKLIDGVSEDRFAKGARCVLHEPPRRAPRIVFRDSHHSVMHRVGVDVVEAGIKRALMCAMRVPILKPHFARRHSIYGVHRSRSFGMQFPNRRGERRRVFQESDKMVVIREDRPGLKSNRMLSACFE